MSGKKISIGGLITVIITGLIAAAFIINAIIYKNTDGLLMGMVICSLVFICPTIALLIRIFRQPYNWKKGLSVWFGGFICGMALIPIIEPLSTGGSIGIGNYGASLFFLIIGIPFLWIGFKR